MAEVLIISGSPAAPSSTDALLEHAGAHLAATGHSGSLLRARELPGEALLAGDTAHPQLAAALDRVAGADAVVLGSPVYKATYTGLLKAFVDLLPMDAFAGKPVLPFLTGGSPAHVLALDYGLKPLAVTLGATHVADGRFVLSAAIDKHVDPDAGGPTLTDPKVADDIHAALAAFEAELDLRAPAARLARRHQEAAS
ncbi:NADPH-dependent FMN reductase [Brevibacterium sp. 5221]|uniref:NADPH-dependent FMN reductase n=1 Tax=Brevibacterium rongguiense TaxID=2695267 RepID=A0A6N9H3W8_9MICO|nr:MULTISPECIES: NADPH-dependent FMN reductase [Brevibacterium]MYM18613.1 NADPH-dependent FMN reductase [Brevibacterium rongguiense]WAL41362.1 NADPH-dependent FMN reductase [Brevibacterium sp. BRM-1]